MKRPTYRITLDGKPAAKAHAWNSALRAMRAAVRDSLAPGESAEQVSSELDRPDKWTFLGGVFRWSVSPGPREILAEIHMEEPPTH